MEQYHWEEADGLAEREDVILLDVRTEAEYRNGHIPGAVNIPLDELRERLSELDREKDAVCELPERAEKLPGLPHPVPERLFLQKSGGRLPVL